MYHPEYEQQSNNSHVHDLSPAEELAGAVALVLILLKQLLNLTKLLIIK